MGLVHPLRKLKHHDISSVWIIEIVSKFKGLPSVRSEALRDVESMGRCSIDWCTQYCSKDLHPCVHTNKDRMKPISALQPLLLIACPTAHVAVNLQKSCKGAKNLFLRKCPCKSLSSVWAKDKALRARLSSLPI